MFPSASKTEYIPLASQLDGEPFDINDHDQEDVYEKRNDSVSGPNTIAVPHILLWGCLFVAFFSAINVLLVPFTLSNSSLLSERDLKNLPYPDQHLGLDRAAKAMPPPPLFHFAWPEQITHTSQKLKSAVYGSGTDVFISVQDNTVMQFRVPAHGTENCAIAWTAPPDRGPRKNDLETKGDISEIEVWSIIATNPTASPSAADVINLDFDALSWDTRPVRGELLGTLDLTSKPNATTVDFACPREREVLTVEFRCLRVACHVKFRQVHMLPKMGFELLRRHE